MSRRRRTNKPMDPAEAARLAAEERRRQGNPANWGADAQALALPANADVEARRDAAQRITRAMRYDCFSLLYYRPGAKMAAGSYDAVRRLQKDLAILHQTQGTSDQIRTASAAGSFLTEKFSIARKEAGERVHEVLHGMVPWRGRLILDLCETEVTRGQTPNWHAIVMRHTGELDRIRRGELVREACDDLAASYRAIDNQPRRAVG